MIKICISVTSHTFDPLPTVTPRTPSSVTYFMDGPLTAATLRSSMSAVHYPTSNPFLFHPNTAPGAPPFHHFITNIDKPVHSCTAPSEQTPTSKYATSPDVSAVA